MGSERVRNRVFAVISAVLAGLGASQEIFRWPAGPVDAFGYTWNVWLTAAGMAVVLGLYLDNRDLRGHLEAIAHATPLIRVIKPSVRPMNPGAAHPDDIWWSARVIVRNAAEHGPAKAVGVRAAAVFEPIDAGLVKFHEELIQAGGVGPPSVDCRWASGYGIAGALDLNPSQERELDIAIKWKPDPGAFAFDDRAYEQFGFRRWRVPEYCLYPGDYRVRLTISGNFTAVHTDLRLHNHGQGEGIDLDLVD